VVDVSARGVKGALIWTLVGAPLAALANLELLYALVPGMCDSGRAAEAGLLHAASAVTILVAALAVVSAWRLAARAEPGSRTRVLARAGLLVSAVFTLVVIAMWIPVWSIGACART